MSRVHTFFFLGLSLCVLWASGLHAAAGAPLDFTVHRLGSDSGPTLLVVGGIQGDEPGGFSAASLLVTNYTVVKGRVWVVPNLNFSSIIQRSRGPSGDMNRKFAFVDTKDPDYAAIQRIQRIILDPQVDVVLNLHDGSGFYRPQWENATMNPKRWGQCVIIDQEHLDAPVHGYGKLAQMAEAAVADGNKGLLSPDHRYNMRNTNTRDGDKEMEKTLSYFAVRNGKPAFGIEASKTFTTEFRSYYHIQILESFMRQMGIEFHRNFDLTPAGVKAAINSDVQVALYNNRVVLPLDNVRPSLAYIPFKKGAVISHTLSKPLLAVVPEKNTVRVAYGNRTLTRITPQYIDFDESLQTLNMLLDDAQHIVPLGQTVTVNDSFLIKGTHGYRVNAIGAVREKSDGSECDVVLRRKDFMPRFSVDKGGTIYRVELYKGKAFAGMILVRFGAEAPAAKDTMTASPGGAESSLGR